MGEKISAEQTFESAARLRRRITFIYAAAVLFCFAGAGALGWDILWISRDRVDVRSVQGMMVAVLCAFIALPFLILSIRVATRFCIRITESVVEVGKGWNRRTIACDDVRMIEPGIQAGGAMIRIHGARFHLRVRFLGNEGFELAPAAAAVLFERCRNAAWLGPAGEVQLPLAPKNPSYPLSGLEAHYRRGAWTGIAGSVFYLAAALGLTALLIYYFLKPTDVRTIILPSGRTFHYTLHWSPSTVDYCFMVISSLGSFVVGFASILETRNCSRRLRELRQRLKELGSSSNIIPGSS